MLKPFIALVLTAAVVAVLVLTGTFGGSTGSTGLADNYSSSPITPMSIVATRLPAIPAVAIPLVPKLAPTLSPTVRSAAAGFDTPTSNVNSPPTTSKPAPISPPSHTSEPMSSAVPTRVPTPTPPPTPVPTPPSALTAGPTPTARPTREPTQTPWSATMVVGNATGAPGEQVTLDISLDTAGTPVRAVQLNLAFDGATLTSAVGGQSAALPPSWLFVSNSPAPGDLRFVSIDLSGGSQPLNGPIFTATFAIDANAPAGNVPIEVVEYVSDGSALAITVVTNGAVNITASP